MGFTRNEEVEAVMQAEEEQKKLEQGKLEELEKRAVAAARLAEQNWKKTQQLTIKEKVKSKNEKQKQKPRQMRKSSSSRKILIKRMNKK